MTKADEIFDFVAKTIRVPEGKLAGKPLELCEFQREIINGIYNRRTRRAIVSVARKNGKTALAGALLLAHLVGPCATPNSSIYSTAQSREQAAIVFGLAAKMIRMSPQLNGLVTVRDSKKELYCGRTGVTYRALSADATTAYGLSPAFVVHDELGLVKGSRSDLYEAIETAAAAHEDPLSLIISTQAPSNGDLLSLLIDDAKADNDPLTRLFLWTAPEAADPFALETIRLANPALGIFQSEAEVMAMAADAARLQSREPGFRNLILNQRVDATSSFISRALWESCGEQPEPLSGPVYAALDLGQVADLTSWLAMSESSAKMNVHPTYWLPGDDLEAKSRQDHFDYVDMAQRGYVTPCTGKAVSWDMVGGFIADQFRQYDIRKVGFDRYRFLDLKPHLIRHGLSEQTIADRFVEVGQGFRDQARAVDAVERAFLDGRIRHGGHPVLAWNIANCAVLTDDAGNRKISKKRSYGRIDGAISLGMCFFVAPLAEPPREPTMFFVGGR
jgi:phage terminase large subunit-like protein